MGSNFTQENSYDNEKLLLCSEGNLFGEDNGKLPNSEMLMINRILIKKYGKDHGNCIHGMESIEILPD